MPTLEKLHKEWKSKGLAVVGIDGEEPEPVANTYKKMALTFTTVFDPEQRVRAHYGGLGIPFTVVIDRKGRVVAEFLGGRPEKELLATLRRAGLK